MGNGEPVTEYFLWEATVSIHNTNRSVTCDNWFTSISVIKRLNQEPYDLTVTGTIRKNKQEVLEEMKVVSKNPPETNFCHPNNNITLLCYTQKETKLFYYLQVIQAQRILTKRENQKSFSIIMRRKAERVVSTSCIIHSHWGEKQATGQWGCYSEY